MSLDEDSLHRVAQDGEMDWAKWPALIEPLLDRLNQIVNNEFPVPRPYPLVETLGSQTQHTSIGTPSRVLPTVQISQTPTTPRALPPVPAFPGSSAAETATSHVPNSQPDQTHSSSSDRISSELPIIVLQQLNSIVATLRASFYTCPPHTIQRLSELTLDPRRHYKTLPAWLRAVDRVVSVSSTADIFPLADTPTAVNGINGDGAGGILWNNGDHLRNGVDGKERDGGLGSDESLGGALLTPIPWLREVEGNNTNDTESMNGDLDDAGAGADTVTDDFLGDEIQFPSSSTTISALTSTHSPSSDSRTTNVSSNNNNSTAPHPTSMPLTLSSHVSDPLVPDRPLGAVTQGELIRMEQEAGVIPVSHSAITSSLPRTGRTEHAPSIALGVGVGLDDTRSIGGNGGEADEMLDSEATPHARGPQLVGTVDMGLVGGKGVEVKLSSGNDSPGKQSEVNVHDAQNVLAGGQEAKKTHKENEDSSAKPTAKVPADNKADKFNAEDNTTINTNEEGYVDVGKEVEPENDEMQLDDQQSQKKDVEGDGDIVLVDADGFTEEERHKIDASDLNVGSETADGSAR